MNLIRLGTTIRSLRRRQAWRQIDLARRAQTSQQVVSRLERGIAGATTLSRLERVLHTLEADVDIVVRWRGGALDRLLDERHAALQGEMARRLVADAWTVLPEVSYSEFGERGSIDLLAIREPERLLLVVEIRTELTSNESTLRKHDEKARLAPNIARVRLGDSGIWATRRLLVLPDSGSARRRIENHRSVLDHAYPLRGHEARVWLRPPFASKDRFDTRASGGSSGLSAGALIFLPPTPSTGDRRDLRSPLPCPFAEGRESPLVTSRAETTLTAFRSRQRR